jgi:4-aminobutyrate aminotransferase/(S)-3-amino-2-methylpropionate transaminase
MGQVRGRGAMIGIEFVEPGGKEPSPGTVSAVVTQAREMGLMLLSTGTYGNVIRLLPPLRLSDAELDEGLDILERSIRAVLEPVGSVA